MAPIGQTRSRVREWIWAHPRGARGAMAGAVAVAVAAGAFVMVRPDGDDAAGRQRHRQYAGSTETPAGQSDASSDSTVPGVADTSGSAPAGSPATGRGTGTTSAGSPTTAGGTATTGSAPGRSDGPTTSIDPGQRSTSPQPGTGTTPTTGPASGGRKATPATGTDAPNWALLPTAPIGPRHGHAAVWTGREMVIWGGTRDFETDPFTDGGAYNPATRIWRKVPAAPLAPRHDAWVSWTGQAMLVFGGTSVDGDYLADGALWDPADNTWRSIPASPLGPRDGAVVAWAGDRLVVWSGTTVRGSDAPDDDAAAELKNDGAAYVPATNTWVPVGAAPIPPRSGAQSAWTGSRLIVSGGDGDDDDRTDGAAFDPASGAWTPIATRPEPGSCGGDTACVGLWTGTAVLFPASSLAYDPAADRWSAVAAPPGSKAPAPGEPAVWTGRRLVTWGMPGDDPDGSPPADTGDGPTPPVAATYDPVANRWQPIPAGPLGSRAYHTAVWTGDAMLIWGGMEDETALGDGAAYRPE